eukprot:COSAG02_NODE_131_length_34710_cov_17.171159_37_plen_338_part_00
MHACAWRAPCVSWSLSVTSSLAPTDLPDSAAAGSTHAVHVRVVHSSDQSRAGPISMERLHRTGEQLREGGEHPAPVDSSSDGEPQRLAPRAGVCIRMRQGERLRVINTHGQQVVDLWAWIDSAQGATEQISQAHTRSLNGRLSLEVGDALISGHRRPLLTLLEDTTAGRHDMLGYSCDRISYVRGDGIDDSWPGLYGHSLNSCCGNLWQAQLAAGVTPKLGYPRGDPALGGQTPEVFNLFMNCPWDSASAERPGGRYAFPVDDAPTPYPTSKPGEWVTFRAEQAEVLVGLSTCPSGDCTGTIPPEDVLSDLLPTDQAVPRQCTRRPPTEIHYAIDRL